MSIYNTTDYKTHLISPYLNGITSVVASSSGGSSTYKQLIIYVNFSSGDPPTVKVVDDLELPPTSVWAPVEWNTNRISFPNGGLTQLVLVNNGISNSSARISNISGGLITVYLSAQLLIKYIPQGTSMYFAFKVIGGSLDSKSVQYIPPQNILVRGMFVEVSSAINMYADQQVELFYYHTDDESLYVVNAKFIAKI